MYLKLVFSGHLYKGKGIDLILKIAKKMKNIEFHILGGPNIDIPKFKKIATSNCIFYGNVEFAKVHKILIQFDLLLAPYSQVVSIGKGKMDIGKWMSPLKIFEYMAIGKPFITSKMEVLEEFLVDGSDAILAKPDDVNDWIINIRYMQQNPDTMLRMSKALRLKFIKNFTWDQRAKKFTFRNIKMFNVYKKIKNKINASKYISMQGVNKSDYDFYKSREKN